MASNKRSKTQAYNAFGGGYGKYEAPAHMQPAKPLMRSMIPLPSKTIIKRPLLLEPYTKVNVNQIEEVIDLDELRSYGRYAIIQRSADDGKKQFVVSNNITEQKEVSNPDYDVIVAENLTLERANSDALKKYEDDMARYKKSLTNEAAPIPSVDLGPSEDLSWPNKWSEVGKIEHTDRGGKPFRTGRRVRSELVTKELHSDFVVPAEWPNNDFTYAEYVDDGETDTDEDNS